MDYATHHMPDYDLPTEGDRQRAIPPIFVEFRNGPCKYRAASLVGEEADGMDFALSGIWLQQPSTVVLRIDPSGSICVRRHRLTPADHPSGDKRFKILDTTMKRFQFRQDALIEVLHKAQELFGFLELDVLFYVAHGLKLPPSRVYGVATFYHLFSLRPQGEHTCVVCMGTACFVKGSGSLIVAAEQIAHVRPGKTTKDKKLSLLTARCIGACGIAPVVVYDQVTDGRQTPETVARHLKEWL
jgi:bidirectional [NiFe] hydrogenase diaphorase subunit